MERRKKDLFSLQLDIGKMDTEITMVLQQLQWSNINLLTTPRMMNCDLNTHHRTPVRKEDSHREYCILSSNGYCKDEALLPDPVDTGAGTLIRYSTADIRNIIDVAAKADPSFKRGSEDTVEPLSLARLQTKYSADERRAIHDAVVAAAPRCHDLADLALVSDNGEAKQDTKQKSRLEILAELRDMKRRRTKYRVAAKSRNYSDVLRDVIRTQMEVFSEVEKCRTIHDNEEKDGLKNQNINEKCTGDPYYDIELNRNNSHKVKDDSSRHRNQNKDRNAHNSSVNFAFTNSDTKHTSNERYRKSSDKYDKTNPKRYKSENNEDKYQKHIDNYKSRADKYHRTDEYRSSDRSSNSTRNHREYIKEEKSSDSNYRSSKHQSSSKRQGYSNKESTHYQTVKKEKDKDSAYIDEKRNSMVRDKSKHSHRSERVRNSREHLEKSGEQDKYKDEKRSRHRSGRESETKYNSYYNSYY